MVSLKNDEYGIAQKLFSEKRFDEAYPLYEKLAHDGDPRCQVFVGWMCHEGLGVGKSKERAFCWFQGAARLGSRVGAFYCGKLALAESDYKEALRWFLQAAMQEYGPALLWLGLLHIRGLGVQVDIERGAQYLERAVKTGNFPAEREIALLMLRGKLGARRIPTGLILFPYAFIKALVNGVVIGHSDKLMG